MSAAPSSHPPLARGPSVASNDLDLDDAKAHEHDASHTAALMPPPERVREGALVDSMEAYRAMYDRSVKDPRGFWSDMARSQLTWFRPFSDDQVLNGTFQEGNVRWFADGQLNISYNCIDRHVAAGRGDQIAIIHEGDEPGQSRTVTYSQLLSEVCRVANVLTAAGVKCVTVSIALWRVRTDPCPALLCLCACVCAWSLTCLLRLRSCSPVPPCLQEGRLRDHLPAHDDRHRLRHAGLHAHRRPS